MKNTITTLAILFLLSASASALCDSTHTRMKQELGLVFYSNKFNYFPYKEMGINYLKPIENYFFNGIQFKIIVNEKNALRTTFQYTQLVTDYETDSRAYYWKEISLTKGYEIRTGYERIFCSGKIKPFAFADLSYSYSERRGYREWWGDFSSGAGGFWQRKNTQSLIAGGGVKYFPYKNIFLSMETSIALNFNQTITADKGFPSYSNKFFEGVFNPVKALSFGVKF